MKDNFFMPIYLNRGLVLDLHSIFIDGSIESTSVRFVRGDTEHLKLQNYNKTGRDCAEKISGSYSAIPDDKEYDFSTHCSKFNSKDFSGNIEGSNTNTNEVTLRKISTNFSIFNNLKNTMFRDHMFREISKEDIINEDIKCGEYVEFNCGLSSLSLLNDVNNIIDILECYDCTELDKLIEKKENEKNLTNYSVILKQLKLLSSYLCKNDTVNMVTNIGECRAVLNVNLDYFSDKHAYMYDTCDTACKVFGKVIKMPKKGEEICFLSKTGMSDYYRKFLDSLSPYLDILKENNIVMPNNLVIDIECPAIQVIPIAMYL